MRKLRLTRKGWMAPLAAVVAIGILVALAFYVRGFEGTGDDPQALPTESSTTGSQLGAPDPLGQHPRHHGKKGDDGDGTKFVVPGGGPTVTLGGGSGLTIAGSHTMVAHVESSEPINVIGYLSPTSPDLTYGTVKNVGRSWTVRTTVSGPPKYAILWIYGAKDGASVTCSITIDGKVADRKTTKGPYGRQLCFA
jgi:hypothetical protein